MGEPRENLETQEKERDKFACRSLLFLLAVPICPSVYHCVFVLMPLLLSPNPTICFLFPASLIFPQVGL